MSDPNLSSRLKSLTSDEPPLQLGLADVVADGRRLRRRRRVGQGLVGTAAALAIGLPVAAVAPAVLDDEPRASVAVGAPADDEEDPLRYADLSAASPEQAREIADRKATPAEYEAAFRRFQECMSAAGYPIGGAQHPNGLFIYSVPDAAVQSGVDWECYTPEFQFTDTQLQLQLEGDPSEGTLKLRRCLKAKGVTPGESWGEMTIQAEDAGVHVGECLLAR